MGKTESADGPGAGKPQIIVHDRDGGTRPSQTESLVDQRVLASGGLGVVLDLCQRRLANIDEGGATEMVGSDGSGISHGGAFELGVWLRLPRSSGARAGPPAR